MRCLTDISALEFYRSCRALAPDLLDMRRTSKLHDCGIAPTRWLAEDLGLHGVSQRPFHLLVGDSNRACSRGDVTCHIREAPLPPRSLITAARDLKVISPELLFCSLAARDDIDEVDLALIGYELCGFYLLDAGASSWDGYTGISQPLTNVGRISRKIKALGGFHGVPRARAAIAHVRDGSNSPMESIMDVLFLLPRRLGGMGITGKSELNGRVRTPGNDRFVDLLLDNVGLEYKGKQPHSIEKVGRDDRRQNKLTGSGISVINVWYEDLVQDSLFRELVLDVYRAMGKRLRIRDAGFESRQMILRARLLPALKRFSKLDL